MAPRKNISPESVIINGVIFNLLPSESNSHRVGVSGMQIVKIENCPHENKLRTLEEEVEVIRFLNSHGCKSCPYLLAYGKLEDGRPYFIEQRLFSRGKALLGDILLAVFEQKQLGIYQGDLHPRNIIFDGRNTYLIDYDQAIMSESIIQMGEKEFFDWIRQQKVPPYVLEGENLHLDYIRLLSHLPRYL